MTEKKKLVDRMVQDEILDEFKKIAEPIIEKLKEFAKDPKNRIAIITHNNPDPDALSSCQALEKILYALGLKKGNIVIFAHGDMSPETKVIKEELGIEIQPLEKFNRKKFKKVVLVDAASIDQSNIKLKNGNQPDLIIDHHNDGSPFGATATFMSLSMTVLDVEIDKDLATALAVGIDTDTNHRASKKFTEFDELAYYKILSPLINHQLYVEIVECGYSDSFFEMLTKAITPRKEGGYYHQVSTTVVSGVGYIRPNQKTDLAKIADFLLKKRSVDKVVVLGEVESEEKDEKGNIIAYKKSIVPAVRSSTGTQGAGELSKLVFGEERAGGDAAKASGEVPLNDDEIKDIERAKKDKNHTLLEGLFIGILNKYEEKILEEETK